MAMDVCCMYDIPLLTLGSTEYLLNNIIKFIKNPMNVGTTTNYTSFNSNGIYYMFIVKSLSEIICSKYSFTKNGMVTQLTSCPMITHANPKATLPSTFLMKTSPEFIVVGMHNYITNANFAIDGIKLALIIAQHIWFEITTIKKTVAIIYGQFSNALLIVEVFKPNPCPKNIAAISAFGTNGKFS